MQRHARFIVLLTAVLSIASPGSGDDSAGVAADPNAPIKISHSRRTRGTQRRHDDLNGTRQRRTPP